MILIVGWLARPRDIPQSPPPVPSETELQELARRTQRRSLDNMSAYFGEVAADVRGSLAYLASPGLTAIVWDEDHLVSGPIPDFPGSVRVSVDPPSGSAESASAQSSRRIPLSILGRPPALSRSRAPARAASPPRAGDWIVAVWQTDRGPAFAPAIFGQSAAAICGGRESRIIVSSLAPTATMAGGGVFNMDGQLLGVILPCPDGAMAVDATAVDDMLRRAAAVEERVLASHGVLLGPIRDGERTVFTPAEGVLVREIWAGTPADIAGLWPGDLVVAINDRPAVSMDDLRAVATGTTGPFELRTRRGMQTLSFTLGGSAQPPVQGPMADGPGLIIEPRSPAYPVYAVLPGSAAERAGIRRGDQILRINRAEPRNAIQVQRALTSGRRPMLLEILRGHRRIAIVLP